MTAADAPNRGNRNRIPWPRGFLRVLRPADGFLGGLPFVVTERWLSSQEMALRLGLLTGTLDVGIPAPRSLWLNTSTGRLMRRNDDNTAWEPIDGSPTP